MLSSWWELGRSIFGKRSNGHNKELREKRSLAPLRAATLPVVELLEGRTLMAVLPEATVADHFVINRPGDGQSHSSPSIAYDPTNSLKMVTVYTHENPGANGRQRVFVRGAYTVDGGLTWAAFNIPGNQVNPTLAANVQRTLEQATDAMAGFDRLGNFYVTYSQHDADYSAGNVILQKFDFSGIAPVLDPNISNVPLYKWVGADPVFHPSMVVNSNLASFIDPETGQEQTDPTIDPVTGQGPIYVSWSTNETAPQNVNDWNPNSIEIVGSSDGGVTFSATRYVNDGDQFAGTRNIMPRLTISQGTVVDAGGIPRVVGGQLGIVWDDFWTLRNANPNPLDQIFFDRVQDGGGAFFFSGSTGPLVDALPPPPNLQVVTNFTAPVTIPANTVITDLNVRLVLRHPDLTHISVSLVDPTGLIVVPLVLNRQDRRGNAIVPAQGLAGVDLGWQTGTTFDQEALNSITTGTAPFLGTFSPEFGDLSQFYPVGGGGPALNGNWTLQVTDFVQGPNPIPVGQATQVVNWSLNFTRTVGAPLVFNGSAGTINDAIPYPFAVEPGIASFTSTVTIPAGETITDLDVLLTMRHPDLSQVLVELVDPTGLITVPLVLNGIDLFGQPIGNNPVQGLTGADLGWLNAVDVGTQFDMEAPRPIAQGAAPYLVSFQPEGDLTQFYGLGALDLDGDWTLRVTDLVVGPTPLAQGQGFNVTSWGLKFSFGLTTGNDAGVATTLVRGNTGFMGGTGAVSPFPLAPAVAPDRGIPAGPVIASDNTLGSFSQFQGRLYVAFTGRQPFQGNPADNTDIFLATSDNGGLSWSFAALPVNDDLATTDGFSEGGGTLQATGRPQLMPSVTVDQTTGTLVVSYYDARHDAARARVAQMISTSIDGGLTFGPSMFANLPNSALDAATGQTVVLGPVPDNQSAGANGRDTDFAFGLRQGLVAFNGEIHPVWAGNRNLRGENSILTSTASIAGGPRIIESSMGPVSLPGDFVNPADPSGSPRAQAIRVVFDRIIRPESFTPEDVVVIYRDANTPGTDPGIRVPILEVVALDEDIWAPADAEGATEFLIIFDTSDPAVGRGTGTYSYMISPDVSDGIRSSALAISPAGGTVHLVPDPSQLNLRIPPFGTGGAGDPLLDTTVSTINYAGVPGQFVTDVNVTLTLNHTFDGDLEISLIAPDGTQIFLTSNNGGNGDNFTDTVFDDAAAVSIASPLAVPPYLGTFSPLQPLSAFNGLDPTGDWTLLIDDQVGLDTGMLVSWALDLTLDVPIPPVGTGGSMDPAENTTISVLNLTGVSSNQSITDVNVHLTIEHELTSDLDITLIAPDGITRIPLILARGTGADFTDTVLDDEAVDAISTGANPFTATFQPESPLDVLDGMNPGGTWTLEIVDNVVGGSGRVVSWSLDIEALSTGNLMDQDHDGLVGEVSVSGDVADTYAAPNPLANSPLVDAPDGTYSYFIGPFDKQTLPLIVPGPHVVGAGFSDVFTATPGQVNLPIPPVGAGGSGVPAEDITRSTITINRPGMLITDLNLRLNLQHTFDSDLVITLITPDGDRILLADAVGDDGDDFIDTIFDDDAAQFIFEGTAPFTGHFTPEDADFFSLDDLVGLPISGDWTLEIEDTVSPESGTLVSWSLINTSTGDNLALNRTVSSIDVTFDRDMDPASFTAADIKQIMGPLGTITGQHRYNTLDQDVLIPASITQSLLSRINILDDYIIGDVDVRLFVTHGRASDLVVTLIAPNGTRVPLVVNAPGNGANFTNTLLDDSAVSGITGLPPYSRIVGYRPASPLSALNGLNIKGQWTLEVQDTVTGITGTLNAWSLLGTPALSNFTVTPVDARTFTIGFPVQDRSGTYTISLGPDILSADGEQLDTNLNAGLDLLRGESATATNTLVRFNSTNVPQPIGDLTAANKIATSTIVIPDGFVIQDLQVQLNISYPRDTDLVGTLIGPGGTRVILFSGVGVSGTQQGFSNTIFDDDDVTDPFTGTTRPIQDGSRPFFGRYHPQESLNTAFVGTNAAGTWTLEIVSTLAGRVGTLTSWSLEFAKPLPTSGLGEAVSDDVSTSFRIFVQDPTHPSSHNQWTAVGPAPISAAGTSGRSGGLYVDPSDPSGNTVFTAGASGGIWKTTNFLTTDLNGPTWIPLTDFGPTFSLNMGWITVFGRNNDTNQSIVFGATGEAHGLGNQAISGGVGFIRSMDGGVTWTLLDSTTNVDAAGNPLPIDSPARDHIFAGSSAFKVIVDPRPSPSGEVIVYAALVGNQNQNGIWRSTDTGKHWQRMLAGDATDVILDPSSGVVNAVSNPTGNLDTVYGAIRGVGVFVSSNRGQVWNQMLGGFNQTPLIRDANDFSPQRAIPVTAPPDNPNGTKGRILLAKPYATGNAALDAQYQSWLYALVVTPTDALDGFYMTKDFGQNWTKVRLGNLLTNLRGVATPSNDPNNPDYTIFGSDPLRGQGNYDATMDLDMNNPNIVYIGGKRDGVGAAVIRVDVSNIGDAHSMVIDHQAPDGGALITDITSHADPKNVNQPPPIRVLANYGSPLTSPTINLNRLPGSPFVTNATIYIANVDHFSNTGTGVTWTPFDFIVGNDLQHMTVMRDPLTGLTRLLMSGDHTVNTMVDDDGQFLLNVGNAPIVGGNRTGNLQISQFYFGAAQPSFLGAQLSGSMFYGAAQDDGAPRSAADPLSTGQIDWPLGSGRGDSGGVATDQQGNGTVFQYHWPCCGGRLTDFFQVNGVGRTFGLIQNGDDPGNDQGQWPLLGTINFAVNPLNSNQIMISSSAGRIFGTTNQGVSWFEIGNPGALDSTQSIAMAFGAPNVGDPTGALNNFMYVGTNGGGIFVTFAGGGANGNNWINISNGLDGSAVQAIVTNPLRGSHEAYAVTNRGVYFMADSSVANPTWVNISGNIFTLRHNPFGDPNLREAQLKYITTMAADWRYFFPDTTAPNSPTHPILFVGGEGGVFRSMDKGVSWHSFPETVIDGGPTIGGYMPNAHITDFDLALGNIDPNTGQPDVSSGPDILLVSTYGRGSFAIRLAPIIEPGSVQAVPSNIVNNTSSTRVEGISAPTAFGNTVRITLVDVTDPANPVIVGGYDGTAATNIPANWTDSDGRFSVLINASAFLIDGTRIIGVRASDESGTTSHDTLLTVIVDNTVPLQPGTGINITGTEGSSTGSVAIATFTDPGPARPLTAYSATIDWGDGTTPSAGTITFDSGTGIFTVSGSHIYNNPGVFNITTQVNRSASTINVTGGSANIANPAVAEAPPEITFSAGRGVASSGAVARFTDPGGPEPVSAYVATIDWGDGTATSTGTITFDSITGVYTVFGTHIYGALGGFAITVTIAHTTAGVPAPNGQVTSIANVLVPGVTVTGGFAFTANEGAMSATQTVATFIDPNGAGSSTYSADIDWGDGTTSTGTITLNSTTGVYTVSGGHLYTNPGTFTILVTVHRTGAADATGTSTANVADVPVVGTGGFIFDAVLGTLSSVQTVATFTDPGGPEPLTAYSATINWGDGQTSAGIITFDAVSGVFSVSGAHLYARTDPLPITVTITHNALTTVVTSDARVGHPALVVSGGFIFNAVEGQASVNQRLATFTDPIDPILFPEPLSSYLAQIDWGDGTSSPGFVNWDRTQTPVIFSVFGSHTYAAPGTQMITVTIIHSTAPNATVTATANIANPAVVASGVTINAPEPGVLTAATVATFTDPGGPEPLTEYSATIDWGDGTSTSAGLITFNSTTRVFSVTGSHSYPDAGNYTIITTISHTTAGVAAPVATASSTARIAEAPVNATGGRTINAVEGTMSSSQVVATFTDVGQLKAISAYIAVIDWGDGSSSAGTVTQVGTSNQFEVRGAHLYTSPGTRTIDVTISHTTAPARTVQSTANVANAAIAVSAANQAAVNEGATLNRVVATFTDANPLAVVGMFTASINWGDGTSSQGTIAVNPGGGFSVTGEHVYADNFASRTITVTVNDVPAAENFSDSTTIVVNNVAPVVSIAPARPAFADFEADFSLETIDAAADSSAGFTYVIDWGDGTAAQTITGGASFSVPHSFASTGSFTVEVTARDKDGATSSLQTLDVTVSTAPTLVSASVNNGIKMRSRIVAAGFELDADVDLGLVLGDLQLTRSGVNVPLGNAVLDWDDATLTGALNLRGVKLANGRYTLSIDSGGGVFNVNFHRLAGDANGDARVTKKDVNLVRKRLGSRVGQTRYRPNADLNADGRVNKKDLKIARKNLRRRLP